MTWIKKTHGDVNKTNMKMQKQKSRHEGHDFIFASRIDAVICYMEVIFSFCIPGRSLRKSQRSSKLSV